MIVASVPSLTRAGVSYQIERLVPDRVRVGLTLVCSCPAFSFGKRADKRCKHIAIYQAADAALRRCAKLHGSAMVGTRMLCEKCLIALLVAAAGKVKRRYTPKGVKR